MNYLDFIFLIPIIVSAWRGFKKGLVIELFTLLALLLGIYGGIHFSDYAANFLKVQVGLDSEYLPVVSFTLTFLAIGAMVYFAGKMVEQGLKLVALGTLNKFAGMVFGITKMVFILSAILVILESYDEKSKFIPDDLKTESLLYQPLKATSLKTIPALEYSDLFRKTLFSTEEE
ncbi:CvpA family protein [Crocinitomix catalasitica]|uniref:CvpA family protein n=1 Tax=Crocinitomix catalasitica TaxID=184607 RepID=UPI00068650D2|nr:CvpA family protein [Crocinitomix catalasitica]